MNDPLTILFIAISIVAIAGIIWVRTSGNFTRETAEKSK